MAPIRLIVSVLLIITLTCVVAVDEVPQARPHLVVYSEPLDIEEELSAKANSARRRATATKKVLTPAELKALYGSNTSATAGAGKTIAIVDAYGSSTAEADLGVFSTRFGLPACTTANGCFKRVDQTGGTNYPANNAGWGNEAALDVQTVHSIAPGAKILLVCAKSSSLADLFAGVNYAKQHANYVSMSFGGAEGTYVTSYDTTYFENAPANVSFFASTGDDGSGVEYPSSSPRVVAVGGTSLITNADFSLSSEQGWSGSGGGCSRYFTAPTAQSTNAGYTAVGCKGKRAVPDVSMNADPNSGVYVYYSYGCTAPPKCYFQVGGTSLAAPLFASRAAIRGAVITSSYVYGKNITYRDITVGSNGGFSCRAGLDLVTGRGSWIGA